MEYNFLKQEKAPKILVEAYKLIGIKETIGKQNNPVILGWAEELGLKNIYTSDEIPWCGLFIAYVCYMAQKPVVVKPLWARYWSKFGAEQEIAMLGDILVFERGANSGHVGIYVGEDSESYHVLGGNQGDAVSIVRIKKTRCISIRRTIWSVVQPIEVRVIKLNRTGTLSENEV